MYFELAERLGRTVGELLDSISSAELTEWLAFYKLRGREQQDEMERMKFQSRYR